jgi:glucose-6-phosphate 1-dehydrogenase
MGETSVIEEGEPTGRPPGHLPGVPAPPDRVADPCILVIFGAAGDLTKRKLAPSLYNLSCNGLLSRQFAVIGFARNAMGPDEFRRQIEEAVREYGIFGPIWNRRYIDHVQILVAETVGVEGRGAYYEEAGVLRDMIQNHLKRGVGDRGSPMT